MRLMLGLLLFAVSLTAQTAPASVPADTVTTTFVIAADFGSNRTGNVQCVIVYPATLEADQYPDINAVASEVTSFLRAFPNRAAALEAMASASTKNLLDKYGVTTAVSVTFFLGQVLQVEADRVRTSTPPAAADEARAKLREARAREARR